MADMYIFWKYTLYSRLPKGWLLPPTDFFPLHKNANETDPGHLSNFKFILCGHFDEKISRVLPKMGVGCLGVGGGCHSGKF